VFVYTWRCEPKTGYLVASVAILVPEFAGSNPAEAFGFFLCTKSSACLPPEGKLNNLSHVPTFAACKRT
jgi:hypothetical protein